MSYISLYALGRMPLAWMPASTAYIITCLLCGPSSGGRTPFALNRSIYILPLGVYQDARGGTVKTRQRHGTDTRQTRARGAADRRHMRSCYLFRLSPSPFGFMRAAQKEKAHGCSERSGERGLGIVPHLERARARSRTRRYACSPRCSCQVKSSQVYTLTSNVNNRQRIWLFFYIPMDTKIGDSTERI